jgi:hypothetical protein
VARGEQIKDFEQIDPAVVPIRQPTAISSSEILEIASSVCSQQEVCE